MFKVRGVRLKLTVGQNGQSFGATFMFIEYLAVYPGTTVDLYIWTQASFASSLTKKNYIYH